MYRRKKPLIVAGVSMLGLCFVLVTYFQQGDNLSRKTYIKVEVADDSPCVSIGSKSLIYTFNNSHNVPCRLLSRGITETNDRLIQQLHVGGAPSRNTHQKIIVQYTDFDDKIGSSYFEENCIVKNCTISKIRSLLEDDDVNVDAVLFGHAYYGRRLPEKKPGQIWMLFMLESPPHTQSLKLFRNKINWTLTYRTDSTIVTPYFKYTSGEKQHPTTELSKNHAEGKSKLVAWFVSNCYSKNGRLNYALELKKHIQVDIYGGCGNLNCYRSDHEKCHEMIKKDYKFYLAFENSNCKDYITEKAVDHALLQNAIPIVMGASQAAYQRALPPNSFLHVDDFSSPKDLANYLIKLDGNDDLYNEYFKWKDRSLFKMIDTHFLCRVCAMLHQDLPPVWYPDVGEWWKQGACNITQDISLEG